MLSFYDLNLLYCKLDSPIFPMHFPACELTIFFSLRELFKVPASELVFVWIQKIQIIFGPYWSVQFGFTWTKHM